MIQVVKYAFVTSICLFLICLFCPASRECISFSCAVIGIPSVIIGLLLNLQHPFFKNRHDQDILEIDLDGLNGYPSSFFEEAFGGIARIYKPAIVLHALRFHCTENPLFIDDIISYIKQERA